MGHDDSERSMSASTVELGAEREGPTRSISSSKRFESRGELGRGGMGRIEDAFDHALGRPVAIKHMLRGSDVDRMRFEREARITARLEHPGIVPVHEAGHDDDGMPYYVMRRVDGRPLAELVIAAAPDGGLALIPNVLAACDAIAYAHARGIVHRDLKPTNILVGPFGETLVIDWGLAREIDLGAAASGTGIPVSEPVVTVAGAVAGTPGFMAPEQARGEAVDARADVFALGATLFYVLAAKSPYDGSGPTEMIDHASAGEPPRWSALPADLPADLRAIVVKALASESDARYSNAGALAADLRNFVTGNLVRAHTYGRLERLRRFARRHRAAIAVAAVSVALLAIGATVSVRGILAERDDAKAARAVAEARQRDTRDAADQLLLENARTLAASDPSGAIAQLRRLAPDSPRWRDAWLVAVAAWWQGIPLRFRVDGRVRHVEVSADGGRAAVTTATPHLAIVDLVARTQRTIELPDVPRRCSWRRDDVICALSASIVVVDPARGITQTFAGAAQNVVTDRRDHAFAVGDDHRLVELGATGVRELATGVDLAAARFDASAIVLWHGSALELWTPARTLPIASFPAGASDGSSVDIHDDTIAAAIGDDVIRWRVEGDRVVEIGRWPREGDVQVAQSDGHVYAGGRGRLRALDAPIRTDDVHPDLMFPTAHGFGTLANDNSIVLFEHPHWIRLGPYPGQLLRPDAGSDGRFLIASSDRDEVLAWDLAAMRPELIAMPADEQPLGLVPPDVWTIDPAHGVVRHAPAGAHRVLDAVITPTMLPWTMVAPDGRWATARDTPTNRFSVYDATTDAHFDVDAVAIAGDTHGLAIARSDGAILVWTPGGKAVELGRLADPNVVAIADRYVAAANASTIARFDGTTRVDTAFAGTVSDAAVAADGRVWVMTDRRELWRWDPGTPPARVEVDDALDWVSAPLGGPPLAHGVHALTVLADPPRSVLADARSLAMMGDDYAAIRGAAGNAAIVDLARGVTVPLRGVFGIDLVAAPGEIVLDVGSEDDHRILERVVIRAPREPAALQRWLREVTRE